jgi:hypothetical protein
LPLLMIVYSSENHTMEPLLIIVVSVIQFLTLGTNIYYIYMYFSFAKNGGTSDGMRPVLLRDRYPAMQTSMQLVSFDYAESDAVEPLNWGNVFIGSVKVAFVAVLETLISARLADNMTGMLLI